MIGCHKNAITFAEEADMSIGMARRPDNAILLICNGDGCAIIHQRNYLVRRYTDNVAHHIRLDLRKPEIRRWHAVLAKELRDTPEALRHFPRPDHANSRFINRVHIDGSAAPFL